jgi:toxin ParE1/3/4
VRVRFTASAREQFLSALAYVRLDSPSAADSIAARAAAALSQLAAFPESGPVLPEFPDLLYREVLVDPYRFFYRIEGQSVWVVAMWHQRQVPDDPEARG